MSPRSALREQAALRDNPPRCQGYSAPPMRSRGDKDVAAPSAQDDLVNLVEYLSTLRKK